MLAKLITDTSVGINWAVGATHLLKLGGLEIECTLWLSEFQNFTENAFPVDLERIKINNLGFLSVDQGNTC